jgi:cell division protein FtsI/penicillin-binding protein 2
MFRRAMCVAVAVSLVGFAFTRTALAAQVMIVGVVKASAADAKEAATLKAGPVTYKIVKDDNGKIVAKDANGKKVEIQGTVANKDGAKWITVSVCKIVE